MHDAGTKDFEIFNMIDFNKYLSCPDCRESGLYCPKHRIEVEEILKMCDQLKATYGRFV